jgi:hypothetical protein
MTDKYESFRIISPWIYNSAVSDDPVLIRLSANHLTKLTNKTIKEDEKSILIALLTLSPEDLEKLSQFDKDFELYLTGLGYESLSKLPNKKNKPSVMDNFKELFPMILTILVTGSYAIVLFILLVVKVNVDSQLRDVLMVLIGGLSAAFQVCLSYYFGTSISSAFKDKTIQKSIDKK